jgi:hypothetical protein
MIRKYPRTKTDNFLLTDFSVLKEGEYLQLLATYVYGKMKIHLNKLIRQLCVEHIDQSSIDMRKKPSDILLQWNEIHQASKKAGRSMQAKKKWTWEKEGEKM